MNNINHLLIFMILIKKTMSRVKTDLPEEEIYSTILEELDADESIKKIFDGLKGEN
ncbi:MAG: hypothetical protein GY804_08675 [Alphaproteobacteria bacterium]|nr:hypothetical protein [Alphaproteobacteria bacterium]